MLCFRRFPPLPWVAAIAIVGVAASVYACGSCYNLGGNPLALPHPQAIEIALATRKAIESNLLSDRPMISRAALPEGGSGEVSLQKVVAPSLVEAWAARLSESDLPGSPTAIHFLFIDTEQSCGVLVRDGAVIFARQPSFFADTHVITTRSAFHALTSGTLSAAEAQRLGMLVLEGDAAGANVLASPPRKQGTGHDEKVKRGHSGLCE